MKKIMVAILVTCFISSFSLPVESNTLQNSLQNSPDGESLSSVQYGSGDGSGILVSAEETDTTITFRAPIPSFGEIRVTQLQDGRVQVYLGSLPLGGIPGEPQLPFQALCFLVPANADLSQAQASLERGTWVELPDSYWIEPASPAVSWSGATPLIEWAGKNPDLVQDGMDLSIYGTDSFFPAMPVQVDSVGIFRQWKLVEVKIMPLSYDPVSGKLKVLRDATINLSLPLLSTESSSGQAAQADQSSFDSSPFSSELRSLVINSQFLERYYPTGDSEPQGATNYVIITTNAIQSGSAKLGNFVAQKQSAGFTVKMVTEGSSADTAHYLSGSNADQRANNIRSWLQSHWSADGIQNVLLLGNPHPSSFSSVNSVPMKMCWPRRGAGTDEEAPTDMFFAELSGNWDRDGDGFAGEYNGDYGSGGADRYCEISIGRIPFYGSFSDLDGILQKCINYATESGTRAWRKSILIPAAISNFAPQESTGPDVFPNPNSRTFGADWGNAIKSVATATAFTAYTLYEKSGCHSDGSAYPLTTCNAPLTENNLVTRWGGNDYGFVTWWGHGDETGAARRQWVVDSANPGVCDRPAETTDTPFFTSSDCSNLDDGHPSFVVQVSCTNGYPENSANLGYSLLKKGAIGTFSGSRVTWYRSGSWLPGSANEVGDNASYAYTIFDRMARSGSMAGAALRYCRQSFGMGFGNSSWMNMLDFNLYGDPALSLSSGSSGGDGQLSGCVRDPSNNFISGALVDLGGGYSSNTNPSGYYIINSIPTGPRTANVSKSGYQSVSPSVNINQGSNTKDFVLQPISPNSITLHLVQNWNMIGLPVATNSSPDSVFGSLAGTWSIYQWNATQGRYLGKSEISLTIGDGYWLKVESAQNLTVSGSAVQGDQFSIPLAAGWNQIGHPFLSDKPWSAVNILFNGGTYTLDQAADGGIIGRDLFTWDGSAYQSAKTIGYFQAGLGYWVKANQPCILAYGSGSPSPLLSVDPAMLDLGSSNTQGSFTVRNIGQGTLTWNVTKSVNWLTSLNPSNGSLGPGASITLVVTISRNGLSPGPYENAISFTSNGGNLNRTVKMQIPGGPLLRVDPGVIDLGATLTQGTFTVHNDGEGALTWNASESCPWIIGLNPSSGSLGTGGSAQMTVSVSRIGLATGNYQGYVNFTSNGGNPTTRVDISVSSNPVEILYDDDGADAGWAKVQGGNGFAVRMTPPSGTSDLRAVSFRFWGTDWPDPGATPFQWEIWNAAGGGGAPGSRIAGPYSAIANRGGWTSVNTSGLGITVSGDFYVLYKQVGDHPYCPGLATDNDGPYYGRSWDYQAGAWTQWPETNFTDYGGKFMIRATVLPN